MEVFELVRSGFILEIEDFLSIVVSCRSLGFNYKNGCMMDLENLACLARIEIIFYLQMVLEFI